MITFYDIDYNDIFFYRCNLVYINKFVKQFIKFIKRNYELELMSEEKKNTIVIIKMKYEE